MSFSTVSRAATLIAALTAVVVTTSCQKAGEAALSAATGGAVDLKSGKMTVTNDKGEKVVIDTAGGTDGKVTITGPKGEQVVMTGDNKGAGGNLTMTGPDGQQVKMVAGDNVALPAECPLKLAPGYSAVTVQGGTDGKGKKTCMVMAKGTGAVADVATFYDGQLKGLGYEVKRTDMKMDQMETAMLAGTKGTSKLNVSVMRDATSSSIQIVGEGL